ncbi:MAG: isoaspartyl peptidase [Methanomassiliicoccales archaeon PtaU1.Bin124]|nr:MAG: isoaspartyl peptidase [Methanomassiliicoccales archaeon PtaU1.Bin124]
MISLIVHGGAWDIPDDLVEEHRKGMNTALDCGYEVLLTGGTSLDAVQAAVEAMEAECIFDAGCGSFLNEQGEVEMDAAIMEGSSLRLGSVASIRNVKHPVKVARHVMERTPHCLLVGQGATDFARSIGETMVPSHELVSSRELQRWKENRKNGRKDAKEAFAGNGQRPSDTVGAVALDEEGVISVATSTGGIPGKMAGRVGDSPLVGSGIYADNFAGVASTGYGESIMKVCLARRVCESVEEGMGVDEAAVKGISYLQDRVDGNGGVIVLDRKGNMSWRFNTPRMAVGYVDIYGHRSVSVSNRES